MTDHTPTPWQIDECEDAAGNLTIRPADIGPNGDIGAQPIATIYREPDAALIVRAVNAHDELVAALQSILNEFALDKADQGMCADPHTLGRINRARAALAKATA